MMSDPLPHLLSLGEVDDGEAEDEQHDAHQRCDGPPQLARRRSYVQVFPLHVAGFRGLETIPGHEEAGRTFQAQLRYIDLLQITPQVDL